MRFTFVPQLLYTKNFFFFSFQKLGAGDKDNQTTFYGLMIDPFHPFYSHLLYISYVILYRRLRGVVDSIVVQ